MRINPTFSLVLLGACPSITLANPSQTVPKSESSQTWQRDGANAGTLSKKTLAYINETMGRFHLPAMSVAILNGNNTIYDAFGYAILGDEAVQATPDTLYCIASLTKSFTAATLLYTLSHSKSSPPLTVRSKLSSVLENFALPSTWATKHATIVDALSHRLGLSGADISYGGAGYTIDDAVKSLKHLPQESELREDFHYFNQGYILLQQVIEIQTGKQMGDVTREAFWDPLGMNATVDALHDAFELEERGSDTPDGSKRKHTLAYGYSQIRKTNDSVWQPWTDSPLVGPGGIISSARDVAAWLHFFMEEKAAPELTQPLTLMSNTGPWPHMTAQLYAMGWVVTSYRGEKLVMHSGGLPGFSSWMAYLPDRQWGAVLLTNHDAAGSAVIQSVFPQLMDEELGVPDEERFDAAPEIERRFASLEENWLTSRERFFPPESLPKPRLPRTLPLSEYQGYYWNDAYQELDLRIQEPLPNTPVKDRTEPVLGSEWLREFNITLNLEWVNGEDFVAWIDTKVSTVLRTAVPARFDIGTDGAVDRVGLALGEYLIERGEMVWFEKRTVNEHDELGEL